MVKPKGVVEIRPDLLMPLRTESGGAGVLVFALHRRRSVIVPMAEDGSVLDQVRSCAFLPAGVAGRSRGWGSRWAGPGYGPRPPR